MTPRTGYYEVKFRVSGESKRRSAYGKTKAEARANAIKKQALLEAGYIEISGNMSVESWARKWLVDYKQDNVNPEWYKDMERQVNNIIVPTIGKMQIKNVKAVDITKSLATLSGRASSSIEHIFLIYNQIFETAVDNDLILKNPCKNAKLPKGKPAKVRRTITDHERKLTLKAAESNPKDGLFVLIMLYCGLRPQEVCVLNYEDIDRQNKILHVTKALKAEGIVGLPKSDAGYRDVPIPSYLMNRIPSSKGLIFTNRVGSRLSRSAIRDLWNRFKKQMEIENGAELYRNAVTNPSLPDDLTLYCYRHTYCTDLQDAGVPINVARELMGHANIQVTSKIYTHHSRISFENARGLIESHQNSTNL